MLPGFFNLFTTGFAALALILHVRLLTGQPIGLSCLDGFVFCGTVFGYHSTHANKWLRGLVWGLGAFGLWCFWVWADNVARVLTSVFPLLLWLAYYGFQRPGNAGLRSWAMAKPLTVAFAWAWVTVLMPVPNTQWGNVTLLFWERSALVYVLALAYDLSDLGYDRRQGLVTLAQRMEFGGTFLLMDIGLVVAALLATLGFKSGFYTGEQALGQVFSLLFSACWLRYLLKNDADNQWQKILIDALMLLQPALILLLR